MKVKNFSSCKGFSLVEISLVMAIIMALVSHKIMKRHIYTLQNLRYLVSLTHIIRSAICLCTDIMLKRTFKVL